MNQQFRVEYLRINPYRYRRLPSLNATGSQIFNLSQEMITSRAKKNLVKPKLQALSHKKEDSKNFYHHSTIYNVKEFKELSKLQDNQESNITKYNELQTKLMVADFKKKVDAFLQKNNYKTNMIGSKITSSLHELESFQSTNNEEQVNKSLCSNKYTIRTEFKSMKATEILVINNNKIVSRQIISSELIQQRLLKQMENFLKDDRFNYDLKMQTMIDQYQDIVNRIKLQAYTIKLPQSYQIQMSDYNEFYCKKEEPQIPSFNNKLDLLADQIIQEIQQSRISTPQMQSQINEEQQEDLSPYIDEVVKTEPVYTKEETPKQSNWNNEQVRDRKISQRKVKPKKQQQQLQSQQQQNEIVQDINNHKSQQSSQSELQDISSSQQFHNKEIRQKKNNQQTTQAIQNQQQFQDNTQPDYNHQVEVIQNDHFVQNTHKKAQGNEKQKGKVHSRKITGETITQKQAIVNLELPQEQNLETLSEKSLDETQQLDVSQISKQEQNNQDQQIENQQIFDQVIEKFQDIEIQQKEPMQIEQNNKIQKNNPQLQKIEQRDAIDIWDNNQSTNTRPNPQTNPISSEKKSQQYQPKQQLTENINVNQRKPSICQEELQIQQEIVYENTTKFQLKTELVEGQEIKQPKNKYQYQEIKSTIKNQLPQEKGPNLNVDIEKNEQNGKQEDVSKVDYQQIINEKMKLIEQKLQQPCLDIIDILLASDLVYDVNIEKYKISTSFTKKFNHPAFMFQQKDEEEVYTHQVIWKHELQEVIPKLQNLNKEMEILIDENDDYRGNSLNNLEEFNDESDN